MGASKKKPAESDPGGLVRFCALRQVDQSGVCIDAVLLGPPAFEPVASVGRAIRYMPVARYTNIKAAGRVAVPDLLGCCLHGFDSYCAPTTLPDRQSAGFIPAMQAGKKDPPGVIPGGLV